MAQTLQRSSDHAGKRMGGRPGFSPLRYPSRMMRFVALYQGEYDPERLVKRLHTVHPMTLVRMKNP